MASDMVVALGKTTVDGRTLFGHNSGRPPGEGQWLCRTPGRAFAAGEKVRTQHLELPQARQTWGVLGSQSRGTWGYHHGVNEHGVAIGCATLRTRMRQEQAGLTGPDLVRLGLERAASARQGVDLLTDLITRHGQGAYAGCPPADRHDNAFLIADGREAFALEASGSHWVYQEVQQLRALSDVCTIRQDWDWIARGLAGWAIERGWWPGDGSKLDFATAVGGGLAAEPSALRRWGRATLLLEEQNGHIDLAFIRRLLSDHYEGCDDETDPLAEPAGPVPICQHRGTSATAASLVAVLGTPPVAWYAFGPPCTGVYFPLVLDGELPAAFGPEGKAAEPLWSRAQRLTEAIGTDRARWAAAREALGQLQARLELDCEEFLADSARHRQAGNRAEFQRLAELFMQHTVECFEALADGLLREAAGRPAAGPTLEPAGAGPRVPD